MNPTKLLHLTIVTALSDTKESQDYKINLKSQPNPSNPPTKSQA